jgi:hypothetical protein
MPVQGLQANLAMGPAPSDETKTETYRIGAHDGHDSKPLILFSAIVIVGDV